MNSIPEDHSINQSAPEDFEQLNELNALREENKNLKRRLYYDLKARAEALRVELKEKQNLLCEANESSKEKDCMITTLEDQLKEKSSAWEKACKSVITNQELLEKELNETRLQLEVSTEAVSSHHAIIENLKSELDLARKDAEEAHKWRQACADVCGIFTVKLKELADDLDLLLEHKDNFGVLTQDRRNAMRKSVDKSLDLSNSLNNISLSMADQQFISSLSDILNFNLDNKKN